MNSTGCKHGNLEFCTNGWSIPRLGSGCRHQINICLNVTFGLSWESLSTPDNRLLFWFILCTTKVILDLCLGCVLWNWNLDHHVGCKQLIRKVGNNFQVDGNPSRRRTERVSWTSLFDKAFYRFHTHLVFPCSS